DLKIRLAQNCSTGSRRPATPDARARATAVPAPRARAHATRRPGSPEATPPIGGRRRDDRTDGQAATRLPAIDAAPLRDAPPSTNRDCRNWTGFTSSYSYAWYLSDGNHDGNRSKRQGPPAHSGVVPPRSVMGLFVRKRGVHR